MSILVDDYLKVGMNAVVRKIVQKADSAGNYSPGLQDLLSTPVCVDMVIKATTEGIDVNRHGNFIVNEETRETTLPGVYAGGDIVLGAATVIQAMGQGRKAAKAMNAYLAAKRQIRA